METIYYAKSPDKDGHQETTREHLDAVANLAEEYGENIGLAKAAWLAGQLHDFGKYSAYFQEVLKGMRQGVDHAVCGAAVLHMLTKGRPKYRHVVEAINGHHNGLMSYIALKNVLSTSLANEIPIKCNAGKTAALSGEAQYNIAGRAFGTDFPNFRVPSITLPVSATMAADMLCTRMLFSCLVDADYTVSAGRSSQEEDAPALDASALLARLTAHREEIRANSTADTALNRLRDALYERCGEMAGRPSGVFTLTAPTGAGKTLALLHFALRHCAMRGKRRIIVVLPFLSLAEQCADEYAHICPDILIDHSQSALSEEARLLAQKWDAPFIITTSVKFFETLFAARPTDCRKLHNLANSVVIFDEAQSLPAELAAVTVNAVNALCESYGCTMVFSTATQPAFDVLPDATFAPTEIVADPPALYQALRRTQVVWRLAQETSFFEIAGEMAKERSVCAIVNLRRHARALYNELCAICPKEEVFFLATDLCPSHRSARITAIRERLQLGLPCRVVSTQCIEAGVDLDFDRMYRALAPLEAIIQAAGRCNRNGRLPERGQIHVFEPADDGCPYPGNWYQKAALCVKILHARGEPDIHDPNLIRSYYEELFKSAREKPQLTSALTARDYKEVDETYRLITQEGIRVIVPYKENLALFKAVRSAARETGMTKALMRQAAPITVSTFSKEAAMICERLYYGAQRGQAVPSDYYVLPEGFQNCYLTDLGLQFSAVEPENYCA